MPVPSWPWFSVVAASALWRPTSFEQRGGRDGAAAAAPAPPEGARRTKDDVHRRGARRPLSARAVLVVASPRDAVARRLVERWAAHGALRLGPADLSVAGWRHYVGGPPRAGAAAAVAGGRPVETAAISGVLTRLPRVAEADLAHVVAADRAYAAAEMTAFLLSWLAALTCPVLNRPTPGCLSGPSWWPEQWAAAAARVGIPTRPMRRLAAPAVALPGVPATEPSARSPHPGPLPQGEGADPLPLGAESGRFSGAGAPAGALLPARVNPLRDDAEAGVIVTVVGDRWFGRVDPGLAGQARRLADAAGV